MSIHENQGAVMASNAQHAAYLAYASSDQNKNSATRSEANIMINALLIENDPVATAAIALRDGIAAVGWEGPYIKDVMDNLKTSMRSPQEAELVYLAGSVMQSVMEKAGQTVSPAMALKIGIVQDQVQDRFDLDAVTMRDTAHVMNSMVADMHRFMDADKDYHQTIMESSAAKWDDFSREDFSDAAAPEVPVVTDPQAPFTPTLDMATAIRKSIPDNGGSITRHTAARIESLGNALQNGSTTQDGAEELIKAVNRKDVLDRVQLGGMDKHTLRDALTVIKDAVVAQFADLKDVAERLTEESAVRLGDDANTRSRALDRMQVG